MNPPADKIDTSFLFTGVAWILFAVATVTASWIIIPEPAIDRARIETPARLIVPFAVIAAVYVAGTYCGFHGYGAPAPSNPSAATSFSPTPPVLHSGRSTLFGPQPLTPSK